MNNTSLLKSGDLPKSRHHHHKYFISVCRCNVCLKKGPKKALATFSEKSLVQDQEIHQCRDGFIAWGKPNTTICLSHNVVRSTPLGSGGRGQLDFVAWLVEVYGSVSLGLTCSLGWMDIHHPHHPGPRARL